MFSDRAKSLSQKLFGKSEVKNKIAKNAVEIILGDMVTLYKEFRSAQGLGALFFNTEKPLNSLYLTTKEIYNDIILAEELMDTDTKSFLTKILNLVEKNEDNETPVVVMLDATGMSVHLLDLDVIKEHIEKQSRDALFQD
jgi:hypothetical protein